MQLHGQMSSEGSWRTGGRGGWVGIVKFSFRGPNADALRGGDGDGVLLLGLFVVVVVGSAYATPDITAGLEEGGPDDDGEGDDGDNGAVWFVVLSDDAELASGWSAGMTRAPSSSRRQRRPLQRPRDFIRVEERAIAAPAMCMQLCWPQEVLLNSISVFSH